MPTRVSSGWGSVWCCVLGSTAQYTGCISSARQGVLAGLWILGGDLDAPRSGDAQLWAGKLHLLPHPNISALLPGG